MPILNMAPSGAAPVALQGPDAAGRWPAVVAAVAGGRTGGGSARLATALVAAALALAAATVLAPGEAGQPEAAAAASWHLPAAHAQEQGATGPSVTSVTSADGLYGEGREIAVTVNFDGPVAHSGAAPHLLLNMSGSPRAAAYAPGGSTSALTFVYTVRAGDYADDLDYYGTGALAGDIAGDIAGAAAADADLSLPAPGSAGSLAGSSDVVVDWSAPQPRAADSAGMGFGKIAGGTYVKAFDLGDRTYAAVTTFGGDVQLVRVHENGTLEAGESASDNVGGFDTLRASHGIDVFAINGSTYALATSSHDSAVQLIRIHDDGAMSPAGSLADDDSLELQAARGIDTFDAGGGLHAAIVTGEFDSGVQLIYVRYDGTLVAGGYLGDDKELGRHDDALTNPDSRAWRPAGELLSLPYDVATFDLDGRMHALVTSYGDNGVQLIRIHDNGTLSPAGSLADGADLSLQRPHGIEAFDLDGRMHALVASEAEDAVQLIRIHDNGTLEAAGSATDGTGGFEELDRPYLISVFSSAGGGTYAAVTGYRDNGVQLIRVRADGALFAAGSASNGDDFAQLDRPHGIDTFAVGGRTYALTAEYSRYGGLQLVQLSPPPAGAGVDPASVPAVARVSSPSADGAYGPGSAISVNVSFTEPVLVTGAPRIELETGGTDRSATYASGSGTASLLFTYTVAAGDASPDLDYAGASALSLGGGAITSLAGNAANLALPVPGAAGSLGSTSALVVDGVRPAVASVSSPDSGTHYANQQIRINVAFDEPVHVTGSPSIGLNAGAGALAVYDSGSGSSTLEFVYDVRRGDAAGALDYTNGTALTLGAGGAIRDAAGNNADLALPTPGPSGSPVAARDIVINTAIVSVNGVTSRNADGAYGAGARINITVSFSEPVRVAGGAPYLLLDTGAPGRNATFVAHFGTWDVWFAYTVQPGDNTDALDYANGSALVAGGATITAVGSGEDARLALPAPGLPGSLSGSKKIALDTSAPKVARVSSPNADGAYGPGSAISVNVSFTEPVLVTGAPRIELETGDTDRSAAYASGSGTASLLFTYTVEAGDMSSGLNYTGESALSLGGGTIRDAAGNEADLALPAPSGGDSLGGTTALVVDTMPPAVESVASLNSTSTYYTNQRIDIRITFDEPVHVSGSPPFVALASGALAVYDSGSGSDTLAFVYDVRRGDAGALEYANSTALMPGAGGDSAIRDAAGNDANLTLPAQPRGAPGQPRAIGGITIDTSAVSVDGVTSPDSDGARSAGTRVNITVSFSDAVRVVGGEPLLKLDTGAADRSAVYTSGTDTRYLGFVYTVQPGDNTNNLAYAGGSALLDGGATIEAVGSGAEARLDLPAPGLDASLSGSKSIALDTTPPSVVRVSSPNATGTYGIGDTVHVAVVFSEIVTVDTARGTPSLALETGATDGNATYASGSGTSVLLFAYDVAEGDASPDLGYAGASALSRNGGNIADQAGNAANLELPAPSGVGSLAVTSEIAVDGARPAAERPVAATASAVFTGPNTVRIDYSAPLGPPAGHAGPVYGGVTIAGGDGTTPTAAATVASVSGLGTHAHTVRFGGDGAGRGQGGSIELAVDLEGAGIGGARHAFTDDVIPVEAAARECTLMPAGRSPVVAIERGGFVCGIDVEPGGDAARAAVNITGLAAGAPAQGAGGGAVRLPGLDGFAIAASFATVSFPPNVTASSVPADGLLELYVSQDRPAAQQVADALGSAGAAFEVLAVVEVGDRDTHIVFNMPVRILLAGQANGSAFYVNNTDDSVVPIGADCNADDTARVHAQLGGSGECQIDSGGDKIIHTYHLTRFGTARELPATGGTCSVRLGLPTIDLGRAVVDGSSAVASQAITRAGTLPFETVEINATAWTDAAGNEVLPSGATMIMPSGAGEWVPLEGEVSAAPGGDGSAEAKFRLDVPQGVLPPGSSVRASQQVTYTVSCAAPG